MGASAYETHVLLVIYVVVIPEVAYRHQTFAHVVLQLNIEAPFRHSAHLTFEYLAKSVLEILGLLVLDRRALGLCSQLFHVAAVLAVFLILSLYHASASIVEIAVEQTVHHRIRIAADRRGKMRVVVEGKSVVTDVLGRIDRLCHRSDGKSREQVLLRTVVNILHQLVDALCHCLVVAHCLYLVAEARSHACKAHHLLLCRLVMHSIDEGLGLLADAVHSLAYRLCHSSVGKQHELLDELV